jgi:ABC-type transporter Mla subunit MlaD
MRKYDEIPDLGQLDRAALEDYLNQLLTALAELDEQEPEDMACEAYETWGDQHEDLEDLIEEVQELIEQM